MPIDPRIALGVQQSTFDPAAAMQNALAIRNARLQEQANQLKLQQEQQAMQEAAGLQNYLAQNPDLTSADVQNKLVSQYGQKGLDILNTQQELANRRLQGKTQQLAYDKANHERIDQLIGDVTRYTTADQANSALDSMLEKGEIDPQTHSMYRNIVVSTPWPQAKTQILGGLRTIQEQFESMQPQEPKLGTYQPGDYTTASWAKFTTSKNPADLQLKPTAPGTSVNVGVSTAKGIAENVGDIAKTSRTQATGAIKTMTSANEIRNALNSGLVIAGPTADLQMKFNQLLTEAGKGSPEKSKQLAQTRTAIINLSKLTLAARAELQGSGAISDFETKLLERAQSGDINDMSVEELQTVVDAAQKGAQFLWGEHQGLLDTMKSDPETAKLARYYTPAAKMPEAAGRTSSAAPSATKGSAQMPVKVNNSQERDKLAPGTVYIGPDGVKRTKS